MLGCGEWHLFLAERGGTRIIDEIPWGQSSFGHVIDDMGQMYISLSGTGCCSLLKEVEPFTHEIVAFRDNSKVPDWAGPIVSMNIGSDSARIDARDVFQWFERRFITEDLSYAEIDLAQIFVNVAEHALDLDGNSPEIDFLVTDCGHEGNRIYKAQDWMRSADALRDLAKTGVDFSASGHQIHVGGLEFQSENLLLTDADVRNATTTKDGLGFATEAIVTGAEIESGGVRVTGRATAGVGKYGLIQQLFREQDILDQGSVDLSARSIVESRQPAPIFLSVTLAPECSHKFKDLRPGSRIDQRFENVSGCAVPPGIMRLVSKATNIAASEGGGAAEAIVLNLSPVGTVSDAE